MPFTRIYRDYWFSIKRKLYLIHMYIHIKIFLIQTCLQNHSIETSSKKIEYTSLWIRFNANSSISNNNNLSINKMRLHTRESGNASRLKNYIYISILFPLLIHCLLILLPLDTCIILHNHKQVLRISNVTLDRSWLTFLFCPCEFGCCAYLSYFSPSILARFLSSYFSLSSILSFFKSNPVNRLNS